MPGTEPSTTLGARLLRARLEYGSRLNPPRQITQMEVGREVGVSGVAVGAWEADRSEPGLDTLRQLARLYEVRVSWLAFDDGPMRDEGGSNSNPGHHNPRPTPESIVRHDDIHGVPTRQQPTVKKEDIKRRPGDRSAVA